MRRAFRAATASAILLAGLTAGELGFRLTRVTHIEGQERWKRPGHELVYRGALGGPPQRENRLRWNSRGEYDAEHASPDTVVLGDSLVEAIQVPLERHASTLLRAAKLACSGWGPIQEVARLEEARAWGWRPRHVVLVFTAANDIRNCRDDEARAPWGLWVLDYPRALLTEGWGAGGEWDLAWWRAFWALERIKTLSPRLTVVLGTKGYPNEPVRTWCLANGTRCVSCEGVDTIQGDGHWSAAGHEEVARRVGSE